MKIDIDRTYAKFKYPFVVSLSNHPSRIQNPSTSSGRTEGGAFCVSPYREILPKQVGSMA